MDYQTLCRTCLDEEIEMWHIEDTILIGDEHVQLSAILKEFYNYVLLPNDQLPENLCVNCVHQLTITYTFKLMIEESANKLTNKLITDDECDQYEENSNSDDDKMYLEIDLNNVIDDLTESDDESETKHNLLKQIKSNQREEPKSTEQRQTLFCVECKSKFQTVESLKEHCTETHPEEAPQVGDTGKNCDYCHKKIKDYRAFMLHKELHLTPYFCENCWIGFNNSKELNLHSCENEQSVRKRAKNFKQCDICGKCVYYSRLPQHRMTHGDVKRYTCSYCPKKFKTIAQLSSHELWNHTRTKNFECEVCGKMFRTSSARSEHVRRYHLKVRKHGCNVCGKRFFLKAELAKHSVSHTGIKNFQCAVCKQSYRTREGLRLHKIRLNHLDPHGSKIKTSP